MLTDSSFEDSLFDVAEDLQAKVVVRPSAFHLDASHVSLTATGTANIILEATLPAILGSTRDGARLLLLLQEPGSFLAPALANSDSHRCLAFVLYIPCYCFVPSTGLQLDEACATMDLVVLFATLAHALFRGLRACQLNHGPLNLHLYVCFNAYMYIHSYSHMHTPAHTRRCIHLEYTCIHI